MTCLKVSGFSFDLTILSSLKKNSAFFKLGGTYLFSKDFFSVQQDTECNAAKTFFWWRLNLKAEKLKKHTFRYGFKRSGIQILELYNLYKVIKNRSQG